MYSPDVNIAVAVGLLPCCCLCSIGSCPCAGWGGDWWDSVGHDLNSNSACQHGRRRIYKWRFQTCFDKNVHPGPCGDDPCWLVVFKWLKPLSSSRILYNTCDYPSGDYEWIQCTMSQVMDQTWQVSMSCHCDSLIQHFQVHQWWFHQIIFKRDDMFQWVIVKSHILQDQDLMTSGYWKSHDTCLCFLVHLAGSFDFNPFRP